MTIAARFRNYFLAGILVTAPISITLWLAWKVVGFVDERFRPLIPPRWDPETYLPFDLPGLGILVVLVGLILIGSVTTGILGGLFTRYSGWLLRRIPIVGSVYSWVLQIFETLLSEEATAFREVVLVEYPYRGSWAVGFITGQTEGEVQDLTSETVYNVFVPATPNPTTGFLLFIPERDIRRLDITVDEGVRLVISGGIVKPDSDQEQESTWGSGTGIAEEVERIKKEMAAQYPSEAEPVSLFGKLRDYLFAGTLISAPVAITIWLTAGVISYFDDNVIPMIPSGWNPGTYLPFGIPGLGLVLAVLSITLVGYLTAGLLGKAVVRLGDRIIGALPLLRGIYSAVKQIFETLLKKQSDAFREVVLVEYPRRDAWAIGFITGAAAKAIQENTGERSADHEDADSETANIFLPTTPNPTSGFLIFLPRSEVKRLNMTVEEGLKMVISGGIVTPSAEGSGTQAAADGSNSPPNQPGPNPSGR